MSQSKEANGSSESRSENVPADRPDYYKYFSDRILDAIEEEDTTLSFLLKFGDAEKGVASTIRVEGETPEEGLQSVHEMLSDFQQYEGTNTHDYPAVDYFDIHFWARHVHPEDIVWSETRIV